MISCVPSPKAGRPGKGRYRTSDITDRSRPGQFVLAAQGVKQDQHSIGQGQSSIPHGESNKWSATGQGMARRRRSQSEAADNKTSVSVELVTQKS